MRDIPPESAVLGMDVARGRLTGVRWVASPNCDARPPGALPELVVVHGISLPPGRFGGGHVDRLFTNRLDPEAHAYFREIADLRVSSHVLIDRRGRVTQYVALGDRAWHAGVSCWRGRERCNDFSIGIELEGTDDTPYEDGQYTRLAELIVLLARSYPSLPLDAVAGHCDIAPGRKTDPGPAFDWPRLRALVALQAELPEIGPVEAFR